MDQDLIVECWKDGEILAAYPFAIPPTLGAPTAFDPEELVAEAKANLTSEGKALPPFQGIEFKIRHVIE